MIKYYYNESLRMIRNLNIKNEIEYRKLLENYLILNVDSLKYISQTRNFKKIIQTAKAVN